jgi:hypothetical protein
LAPIASRTRLPLPRSGVDDSATVEAQGALPSEELEHEAASPDWPG